MGSKDHAENQAICAVPPSSNVDQLQLNMLAIGLSQGLSQEDKDKIPSELRGFLRDRDGAAHLVSKLPNHFGPEEVLESKPGLDAWSLCGLHFRYSGHPLQALTIFDALYEHLLLYQKTKKIWAHKGTPLVWMSDCHRDLNHPVLAKRYLMLTLCEDAIRGEGKIDPQNTGVYIRGISHRGLGHKQINEYATRIWDIYQINQKQGAYPEWILQQLNHEWMTEFPSADEASFYAINKVYVQQYIDQLGGGDGKALEWLAEYLMSCIPGCRAYRRKRSAAGSDYDVACALEGPTFDFRSELGRYFLCECKDWNTPTDLSSVAKFSRILRSAKCNVGVIFSKNDLTGRPRIRGGASSAGERERRDLFQSDNIVIAVVTEEDLRQVSVGASFISILRGAYERVRLNLAPAAVKKAMRNSRSTSRRN